MSTKSNFVLAITLLIAISANAEMAYNVIDLGIGFPESINNNGQVVGYTYDETYTYCRAILFDSTGKGNNVYLGTLGGDHSFAWSINDNGQICGQAYTSSGYGHATLFDSSGGGANIDLGTLGGDESCAYSINNSGQIVGNAHASFYFFYATLFDSTGKQNNLQIGTDVDGSSAVSINNNGQIVGRDGNASASSRPFASIFDPSGGKDTLFLKGLDGWDSFAYSNNDNGEIVGYAQIASGELRAALFDPTGNKNAVNLGTLGGNYSWTYSINNSGQIVGWARTGNDWTTNRATLFDPTGGGNNINLNNLIDPALGWELNEAYCINDNGWIIGHGSNPNGDYSAFLLTPVAEPSTPPIADASTDQTVTDIDDDGSEQVTLDGSGSSDSDGTLISWVWTDDLGDTIPDGETTTATLSVGTHTITLTVTDDDGLTNTDTVTITVEPCPSFLPVADSDGPYTVYVGDGLTLDASGSTDSDNDIVSYLWDLDDDEVFETDAGGQAIFAVDYAYLESLGLLINHTYTIHLKVIDSEGQSDTADSTLIIIPKPAVKVAVDIRPGGCRNPVNVKSSGVLPVAILGSNDYDVTKIDATSIRLAGVEPLRSGYEDVGAPLVDANDCECTELGPDGLIDLTLKFETQKIVEALGEVEHGDMRELALTGILYDPAPYETPIEGAGCILIKGKHKPINKADINKDGLVNMVDILLIAENWLQSSITEE